MERNSTMCIEMRHNKQETRDKGLETGDKRRKTINKEEDTRDKG